jgi:type IV pilus assembly protein PilA
MINAKNKKAGFTLIELLVVIGIIAVLAGVVVVALNPLERIRESRDNRRLQDVQGVRQAVDLGLADGEINLMGSSSTHATGNSDTDLGAIATDGSTGWVKVSAATGATGLIKYMPALPLDPQGIDSPLDGYEWESDGVDYVIRTPFETPKYQSAYGATDGGAAPLLFETGSKAGLTW